MSVDEIERLLGQAKALGESYTQTWGNLGQEWFDHRYDWARGPEYWYWMERGIYASRYINEGDRVLDLCCGDGMYALFYAHKASVVVGVDRDEKAIGHARTHYASSQVVFRNKDVFSGDWGSFDVVTFFAALEHFTPDNGSALLSAIARCLWPGGRLIGSTPLFPEANQGTVPGHRNEFNSVEALREFLARAFDDIEIWTSRWSPIRTEMYFLCRKGAT